MSDLINSAIQANEKKARASAYPWKAEFHGVRHHAPGISKRELLAGMALQGILARPTSSFDDQAQKSFAANAIEAAVRYADKLLFELEATAP